MKVYIGYDDREREACRVARKTLSEVTNGQVECQFLNIEKLQAHGLLTRPVDYREGCDYDLVSNAPQSTRFAVSRFLVPILCQEGHALFVDGDVVFREDPRNMLDEIGGHNTGAAVHVVKHDYRPIGDTKMVDQQQTKYPRKAWSSVMLFDCDHPANRRLSLRDINERPGRDLHAFHWLHDAEIGSLDARWNYLVDVDPRPEKIGIAHLTLGGPWLRWWKGGSFDAEWVGAAK